jgi:hypothetical protein
MKYSILFLLEKENYKFLQFFKEIYDIFLQAGYRFEVLIIANGTGFFFKKILNEQPIFFNNVKAYEIGTATHQSICLKSIINKCRGEFIIVCGSYRQITLESFRNMLDAVDDESDIISLWRQNRFDPLPYRFQSNVFNALVSWITDTKLHDLNCNIRMFRREVLEKTELYGNMYQFLPVFAYRKGFKFKEVKCEQTKELDEPQNRKGGFYPVSVYIKKIIDICTLYFNTSFSKRPLRFFIYLGFIFALLGLLTNIGIFWQTILMGYPVVDNFFLITAFVFIVLGIQSASVGLLGEIIAYTYGRHRPDYTIKEIID